MRVIVVIGMPGSGKTTLLKSLGVEYFDDIFANNSEKLPAFKAAILAGRSVAVSDVDFCKSEVLNKFVRDLTDVEFIYFANDPEQCKKNVLARNRKSVKRELTLIEEYSKVYRPVNPKKIFNGSKV